MSKIDLKIIEKLSGIGLSKKSALVYATLLELDGAYPSKISEVTKLNRSTVYRILTDLSVKGLVSEIEKRKKLFYNVEPPRRLEQYANIQIRLARDRKMRLESIMPEIEGLFLTTPNQPRVRYFHGKDGLEQMYMDHVLGEGKYEMVGWSNTIKLVDFFSTSFMIEYVKKKEKLDVVSKGILPDTPEDRDYNEKIYKNIKKKNIPQMRFVNKDDFVYNGEVTVYGDNKVSFVNFAKDSMVGIIIEDKGIHNMMKMIFNFNWQVAKD